MTLREIIEKIGKEYDPKLDLQSRAQRLLRSAKDELSPLLPPGYWAQGSGGQGKPAFVPWIGIFDPDETSGPQQGMYVVYLFAVDLGTVVLSLMQGVTELERRLRSRREGRRLLVKQGDAIRAALPPDTIGDLGATIELPATAERPKSYQAGNVVAWTYQLDSLPDNDRMEDDLRRFLRIYQAAVDVREELRRRKPDLIRTSVRPAVARSKPVVAEFKPKDDGEYRQLIRERDLVKTRKHETLLREYGELLQGKGVEVATNVHPRDMVATRGDDCWLIEAKVVYRGNGIHAAREALAQLLFYRFLYHQSQPVTMVGLFSEDIGDYALEFLQAHETVAVWRVRGHWHRTPGPEGPPIY